MAAAGGILSAGLLVGAALAPAPPAALPFLVLVFLGCPLLTAWELPAAVAVLRAGRASPAASRISVRQRFAVDEMRRQLEDLPETEHPLGY